MHVGHAHATAPYIFADLGIGSDWEGVTEILSDELRGQQVSVTDFLDSETTGIYHTIVQISELRAVDNRPRAPRHES